MSRYFIRFSYDGTNYHGWQVQDNTPYTVQAALQQALSVVLRFPVEVCGAGRTDTGVHAREMFAHFDPENKIEDTEKLVYQLNSILADDIAVQEIFLVTDEAHARFHATDRTYEYHITSQKDPFLINKAYYFCRDLDLERMNEAAGLLKTYSDFTSFCKLHSDNVNNICRISRAEWVRLETGYKFIITADRFLRNMVRAVVGTLIEVGEGKLSIEEVRLIIEAGDRSRAGFSAPARGLYLVKVNYPDQIRKKTIEHE